MPFLLGMFGPFLQSSQKSHLASIAANHARSKTVQTIITNNGIICAGQTDDESPFSDPIISLPENHGFFVGKLFDNQNFLPAAFTITDAHTITHNPKMVMKQWWGRYAGALYNTTTQRCTLVRDPQGLSTLFYIIIGGGVIFSTDLALLHDTLEKTPSLNQSYFAEYISGTNYSSPLTPFNGILELLPGMGLHIQPNGSCSLEQLWNVAECGGSFIADTDSFEHTLLNTMRSCLKAWVGESAGVCLELSGGADSSGLMILLRDILPEHKNIIGINYIDSKTPSSNEIVHAQEVADMCNAQLHFIDWQDASLLDPLPHAWRPNKPTTFLMFNKTGQQLHDFALQHGCSEIMNGQGGDHVFLAPQPIDSLADYWLDKGLRGITKPLAELSNTNRMPWWMLVRDTTKNIFKHYTTHDDKLLNNESGIYFDPAFMHNKKEEDFYLQKSIAQFYPAKKTHVKSLFHGVAFADRDQRIAGRTITHPLLSQPIVELGLRIPTYQSFNNGFDRIFFRNSVSRIKKPHALWRTIKGDTNSSMAKSFAANAGHVQDMILDGYFGTSGIINKQWFCKEMAKIRHGHIDNLWPVIRFLTAQRWLDQWNK